MRKPQAASWYSRSVQVHSPVTSSGFQNNRAVLRLSCSHKHVLVTKLKERTLLRLGSFGTRERALRAKRVVSAPAQNRRRLRW